MQSVPRPVPASAERRVGLSSGQSQPPPSAVTILRRAGIAAPPAGAALPVKPANSSVAIGPSVASSAIAIDKAATAPAPWGGSVADESTGAASRGNLQVLDKKLWLRGRKQAIQKQWAEVPEVPLVDFLCLGHRSLFTQNRLARCYFALLILPCCGSLCQGDLSKRLRQHRFRQQRPVGVCGLVVPSVQAGNLATHVLRLAWNKLPAVALVSPAPNLRRWHW